MSLQDQSSEVSTMMPEQSQILLESFDGTGKTALANLGAGRETCPPGTDQLGHQASRGSPDRVH